MSQAFCQQCGTRRENDKIQRCATCGAVFPGQQSANVSEGEAPTRIRGQAGPRPSTGQPQSPTAGQPAAQPGPAIQQQWQQSDQQPGKQQGQQLGQQLGQAQHPPGMQQWAANGPPPQKTGNTKLWIAIAVAVLLIGGIIATVLILTLGGDKDTDGGGGGNSSASDTEQIEQVVEDYNDAFQKLMSGDATACEEIAALGTEDVGETELQTCRESVGSSSGTDTGGFESTITFKDATIDGDTAVANVEATVKFGEGEPTTSTEELNLRKIDGDWKIDSEVTAGDAPTLGTD